jgi:hypothetical protein
MGVRSIADGGEVGGNDVAIAIDRVSSTDRLMIL